MSKKLKKYILLYLAVVMVLYAFFSLIYVTGEKQGDKSLELRDFKSDFTPKSVIKELYDSSLSRSHKFLAYGKYAELSPGLYKIIFQVQPSTPSGGIYQLQIASKRGRRINLDKKIKINESNRMYEFKLNLTSISVIEPRILFRSGDSNLTLNTVTISKLKNYFPWMTILIKTIYISLFAFGLLLAVLFAYQGLPEWKKVLAGCLLLLSFSLILRNSWVSEDAYITMRHVDNFLAGFGPVYNITERVEGFTHPLWFWTVSAFRGVGLSAKGALVLPGLVFSLLFLYLLFYKIKIPDSRNHNPWLNFGGAVLIGVSAFIDFGTSGLETSLSYLLLGLFGYIVYQGGWEKKPLLMGLILALLILNRPDFGVFFIFIFLILLYKLWRRHLSFKSMGLFLTFPLIMVGGYQLFRMGYYAALMPNPFYAKSGAGSYFTQGIFYLTDFLGGSLAGGILLIAAIALVVVWRKGNKRELESRLVILAAGLIHAFFVVRGGGDFMHGRFLLPAFILIAIAGNGLFDQFFSSTRGKRLTAIGIVLVLFSGSLWIKPVQKRGEGKYHNSISDERYMLYGNRRIPLDHLLKDEMIFMWKTIGVNYHNLYQRTRIPLTIAYHTIGFIGYYSGHMVTVVDRLGLADPVTARKKISVRRRPGHEKSAPFGYLMLKRLTFGDTPFELWNRLAATKYGILRDLSTKTLRRFAFFLPPDFKEKLDGDIYNFLQNLTLPGKKESADLLFFLRTVWYPFSKGKHRELFNQVYDPLIIKSFSTGYNWIELHKSKIDDLYSAITKKLTLNQFITNIFYAIKEANLSF